MQGKGLAVVSNSKTKNRRFGMYLAFQRIICTSTRSWVRCLKERCNKKCGWHCQFRLERMTVMYRNADFIKIRLPLTFISGGGWSALTCVLENNHGQSMEMYQRGEIGGRETNSCPWLSFGWKGLTWRTVIVVDVEVTVWWEKGADNYNVSYLFLDIGRRY